MARRLIVLAGLLGALGIVRLALRDVAAAPPGSALPILGQVPPFTLTDQGGRPVSREDLAGRIWIANFIFTRCAGQCPAMSAEMAWLSDALHAHPAVRLVSFTVDPEWDTPPVLAAYAARYQARPERWAFVTGDHATITRLCRDGFRLAVAEGEGTPEEPITHSVRVVLIDGGGSIRGYYDSTDPAYRVELLRDVRRLLRAGPP